MSGCAGFPCRVAANTLKGITKPSLPPVRAKVNVDELEMHDWKSPVERLRMPEVRQNA
jgi:hypothetical protein